MTSFDGGDIGRCAVQIQACVCHIGFKIHVWVWRAVVCRMVIKVVELGIFALSFAIDFRRHREDWCAGV